MISSVVRSGPHAHPALHAFFSGGLIALAALALTIAQAPADEAPATEPVVQAEAADIPADYVRQNGINVVVDQAKVIRIDHEANTIIIGNPAIADAVLHDRKTLVITGKAFGATNILIMDDDGNLVIDEAIRVQPPQDSIVNVQRQTQHYTYSCTPTCKPAVSPGDQVEFYENTIVQSTRRNEFARGAEAAK